MASWKKTIASPFKKLFNNPQQQQQQPRDNHKRGVNEQSGGRYEDNRIMDLQGEVMACGYQDVQVMWSILDKSKTSITS